ncbi:TolB family protein [Nocardia sp. NPDC057227]|uniref:TolB family protein n=1 Tax=Nocardia sp. NPDC057227 TaxID=3346056 RepID=UPI00362ADB15
MHARLDTVTSMRHRIVWSQAWTIAVCGALLVTGCGADSGPSAADVIAFMEVRSEDEVRIVQQPLDAADPEELSTPKGFRSITPAFSSSGAEVAFIAVPAGTDSMADNIVYVMKTDGSDPVAIARPRDPAFEIADDSRRLSFPVFSPDGTEVAFTVSSIDRRGSEYHIVGVDGSNLRRLAVLSNSEQEADRVAFSPDGATVVFSHPTDGRHYDLYAADTKGGKPAMLLSTASVEPLMPALSPDGSTIIYSVQDYEQQKASDGDRDTALFAVDADGTDPHRITDWGSTGTADRIFAAWSPNGNQIAFSGSFEGQQAPSAVFVMDADGTDLRRLSPERADVEYVFPAWR